MMRKLLFTLLATLLLSAGYVQSQTVNQFFLYNTSQQGGPNFACGTPADFYFYAFGSPQGANTGDSIQYIITYGDGVIDTVYDTVSNVVWDTLGFNTMHTYGMAGNYTVNATVQILPSGPVVSIPSPLSLVIADSCGTIQGSVYNDVNHNCIHDPNESVMWVPVIFDDGSNILTDYSNVNGNYSSNVPAGPNYSVTVDPTFLTNTGLTVTCPNSSQYTVISMPASGLDLGLECIGSIVDLSVNVWGAALPLNNVALNYTTVQNHSCNPQNTSLTLTFPASVIVTNFQPAPDASVGNTYTWNLANIQNSIFTNQSGFQVLYNIQGIPSLNIGDTICYTATITAANGETNLADNTVTICLPVVNSYDPNDKMVNPQDAFTPGDELTYMVRFQNTGNAPAVNVSITDTIHPTLDMATLKIISSSHPMNLYNNGNILRFDFPNINLPDSNSDEPNSHGYVMYSIKSLVNLLPGDEIPNTAYIYFDFNPAIITNTTVNQVPFNVSVENHSGKTSYSVYPNPAFNSVIISGVDGVIENARLTDATGRLVRIIPQVTNNFELHVLTLTPGVYYLQLGTSGQTVKILKN